jgi:putative transposase
MLLTKQNFVVNLSHHQLLDFRQHNPDSGIIDLKAYYRGFRYVRKMLKMLPEIPEPILLTQIFAKLIYARTYSSRFNRR